MGVLSIPVCRLAIVVIVAFVIVVIVGGVRVVVVAGSGRACVSLGEPSMLVCVLGDEHTSLMASNGLACRLLLTRR